MASSYQFSSGDEAALTNALADYDKGNNDAAERALLALFKRYPDRFEITETLGLIYAERGQTTTALPYLERACVGSNVPPEAFANLGAAYLKLNEVSKAVEALSHAALLDPKNAQTQSSFGHALLRVGRPGDASKAFAAADSSNPGDQDILYNWALARYQGGDIKGTAEILARSVTFAKSAEAQLLLGEVEEQQGHAEASMKAFQTAVTLNPGEETLNALGLELLRHWSFDSAIKVFRYGLSLFPQSARLHAGLGIADYGNNNFEEAAHTFSLLLAQNPNNVTYAKYLGHSCVSLKGKSHDDCGVLVSYAQQHPSESEAATAAAGSILEEHDTSKFDLARTLLDRSLASNPKSSEAYYRLGVLAQEQGRWRESIPILQRSVAIRPNYSKTHFRLALAYSHLGQADKAHEEAAQQKRYRESEDADMETRRRQIGTFVLDSK